VIKTVSLVTRASHLTKDEFVETWTGHHADLVKRVPGLVRYVQNVVDPSNSGTKRGIDRGDIDGIAEFWFQDSSALLAAHATSEWAAVVADARATLEVVVIDGPTT
jgi:uncharacterized protein (TIGR02118 family)